MFTQGAFGPLAPILPVPVDQPPPGLPRAQPRRWQPYPGYNLPVGQPGSEGYKLASFDTLKTLAETYSILRTCLEIRKNEIRALDWDILPTRDAAKRYQGDRAATRDFEERRARMKKFWKRPDPNYYTFESFLHAAMDQVFTIDALSLYMCPKKGRGLGRGLFGSDLDCLWLINGASIRPLMGLHGETPEPAAPGYQQYEFGVPRADLTMMEAGLDLDGSEGALLGEIRGSQLMYHPYLQRVDSPYGFSLVEQALIPIMTGLRKQAYQLNYFDESSVPRVWLSPGDASMTPNQIRELQDAINALAGDMAWAFKVMVVPPNSKIIPQKDIQIVDDSDNWIATEVAMTCNISPVELGLIPKVSSVASPFAAREMAQASRSIHERTSTKPTLSYGASVFDFIIQDVCHQDDMRYVFNGMEETQDQAALTDMLVKQVQSGLKSIDEARDDLHLTPWGYSETQIPLAFTQMGPVPLDEATQEALGSLRQAITGSADDPRAQQALEQVSRRVSASGQSPRRSVGTGRKALPAGTTGQGRMNGPVTQRQARRGGALAPAHATAEGSPGHSGASAPKAALAELEALGRHLARGMPLSEWVSEHLPGHVMAMIGQDMGAGLSAQYAVKAAAASLPGVPPSPSRQQAAEQQRIQALEQQYAREIQAALAAAAVAGRALIAAWAAGTLAVTVAVLASMILAGVRKALQPVLTDLWADGWHAGEEAAGGTAEGELGAFLATWGDRWLTVISGTGEQDIALAVRDSLGDPQSAAAALDGILSPDGRAGLIAVSELTRAWNAAVLAVLQKLGIGWVRWQTRDDAKVCAQCRANQAASPLPVNSVFPGRKSRPPQHPNCRCRLVPSLPPEAAPAGKSRKVLRREVGLNGQEFWTEQVPAPETAGGRVFYPHRADGAQFTESVPGAMTGGEPPRWDGSEPFPVVERAPDADDDAEYGEAAGLGARPGTYWPAPYMDGWWPAPHGQGMTQPPSSSPGSPTGRPPNAAGKQRRQGGDAALRFLRRAPRARPSAVRQLMRENFPDSALGWVSRIRWRGPAEVPLSLIDADGRESWAATHEQGHVDELARKLQAREQVNPAIGVIRAGHNRIRLIDGRHREEACAKLGCPLRMYVGYLDDANEKAAYETYLSQRHSGDSPQNKSFTAGATGQPGNVSGLTPFNLAGAPARAATCAGLVVHAADTGRVLMIQRAMSEGDPAAGRFEWPGGHAERGESLLGAARREWAEETGYPVPDGALTGHWASPDGVYEAWVLTIPHETDIPLGEPRQIENPDGDGHEPPVWWDVAVIDANPAVREEVRAGYGLLRDALSGVSKSAETPWLSSHHAPIGHEGVWHSKHPPLELPPYIQNIRNALMREGMGEREAHAMAVAAIERWRKGDLEWGPHRHVSPEVRRASQEAYEQWMQERAHHP